MAFWLGQTRRKPVPTPSRDEHGMRALLSDSAHGQSIVTSILPGAERGRKHIYQKNSDMQQWRPSRQSVPEPTRPTSRSGKRTMEAPIPWVAGPGHKVHSSRFNARSSTESDFGGGLKIERKNRAVDERYGVPRAHVPSGETSLSLTMGRKRRIDPAHTRAVRNGVGVSNPGDKCYGLAEKAPGFYKEGSAIPGAAWGTFKSLPAYERTGSGPAVGDSTVLGTTVYGAGVEGPPPTVPPTYSKLTFEQRRIAQQQAAELAEIAALNPQKGRDVSWEETTGMFMVPKKDTPAAPAADGDA